MGFKHVPVLNFTAMKIDMGGAAAVLSAFSTLVKAGFTENLHCLMCIAENHISPEATSSFL
jgi:probable aminopeptidase NPEPL1